MSDAPALASALVEAAKVQGYYQALVDEEWERFQRKPNAATLRRLAEEARLRYSGNYKEDPCST